MNVQMKAKMHFCKLLLDECRISWVGANRLTCVQVGPHICILKTHVDLFDSWDDSTVSMLRDLADKHGRRATFSQYAPWS